MWFIYALLSSISWCFVTIFGKLASQRVEPNLLTTLREIIITGMLITTTLLSHKISYETCCAVETKDWIYIALGALFSSTAWLCYFSAFQYGNISKVVAVDRLNFVFIVIMSAYIFGEELSWNVVAGTILMVLGVVTVAIA